MSFTKETAVTAAKKDLASRLGVDENDIQEISVSDKDFPDMSLGAPVDGEMAAQMISSGWQITFAAGDDEIEYRADKYQIRLCNYQGKNIVITS